MKSFKLDFENELRAMGLDDLISETLERPNEEYSNHKSFVENNRFLYSCIMKFTKGHEAREWLTTHDVLNDGLKGWKCTMDQYDLKELQGSL